MEMTPIKTVPHYNGTFYANVNGITKGSIGCYFDKDGNLVANSLYRGKDYEKFLVKLNAEILRRGVVITEIK